MRRREFIGLVGGALASPRALRAQSAMPVIGFLGSEEHESKSRVFAAFHQGLADTGFVAGRNVAIEYLWSGGQGERFRGLVDELIRKPVDVIFASAGISAAIAAKAATNAVPIVFQGGYDPVESGLVTSLGRPGGNITGVTSLNVELGPKRLELLHELAPQVKIAAALTNPRHPMEARQSREIAEAGRALGLDVHIVHARTAADFPAAFSQLDKLQFGGLVISNSVPFVGRSAELGELASRHGRPAIFQSHEFVGSGGLASYSGSRVDAFRLSGAYTGRVLKGEKPADLPVQQVAKIEMILNLKAAKLLGLNVPLSVLGRADEVIE